ncbi:MAG: sodium:solute symporter [Akkermansiaceae bacterium]|nr:sodium:solute symporter [Akkermansiaceae bacterium]MCF7733936.1 sodium:solute symporter [Akkermansiaceae bacterium]
MNNTPDLVIIAAYLVFIVSLGVWVGARGKKKAPDAAKGYFLASGQLKWPVIGLALFSTNISTIHLVSLAQEGYVNGLAFGNFEWMAALTLIILSLFFVPFYIRAKVTTLPDFLEKRYNGTCRDMLAVMSVISAIFIHIGFSLYTGGVVIKGMFGIDIEYSIIAICGLVGVYTIFGGLASVVITESIETVVLLFGAVIITVICFNKLGSWQELVANVEPVKLTVVRPHGDSSGLPWYAVLLGYPIIGIWYWCADQTIVQRVLGAKDENHARVGPLFAGFVKILPVFLFVLPGLMCYALVKNNTLDENRLANINAGETVLLDGKELAVSDQPLVLSGKTLKAGGKSFDITGIECRVERRPSALKEEEDENVVFIKGEVQKDTSDTYAFMIRELLPVGLRGIITASLLAALMGTVSGALNSVSTLVSYDLVKRWRPDTSGASLIKIGRITAFLTIIIAVLWSLQLGRYGSIFQGISALICYIAPPITTVFLWGVFSKRASAKGAVATLGVGALLGFTVFVLDWNKESTGWNVPFLMAAFYLFVICSTILFGVSALFPQAHTRESAALVWDSPLAALRAPGWKGVGNYKFLALMLFLTMVALYWIFS